MSIPSGTICIINQSYSIRNGGVTVTAGTNIVKNSVQIYNNTATGFLHVVTDTSGTFDDLNTRLEIPVVDITGPVSLYDEQTSKKSLITPHRALLTTNATHLVGSNFEGVAKETNYWTEVTTGSATIVQDGGILDLNLGTTANSTASYTTKKVCAYQAGASNYFRAVIAINNINNTNNVCRWGAYTSAEGYFFEFSDGILKFVSRRNSVDTPYPASTWTIPFKIDKDSYHSYDINYRSLSVDLYIDDKLVHTIKLQKALLSAILSLPVRLDNYNINDAILNITLTCTASYVCRFGGLSQVPNFYWQAGTTAGLPIKKSPGLLFGIVISGITDSSVVTLYDSLTVLSGTVIWSSGTQYITNQSNNLPYTIDFKSLAFTTGLMLVISGANCNALVLYD